MDLMEFNRSQQTYIQLAARCRVAYKASVMLRDTLAENCGMASDEAQALMKITSELSDVKARLDQRMRNDPKQIFGEEWHYAFYGRLNTPPQTDVTRAVSQAVDCAISEIKNSI